MDWGLIKGAKKRGGQRRGLEGGHPNCRQKKKIKENQALAKSLFDPCSNETDDDERVDGWK